MSRFQIANASEDGDVVLHDIPLMLTPGTYLCDEAPRFGEKMVIGDLKYADFTPAETGFPVTSWHGGFGLRRYSDYPNGSSYQTMPGDQFAQPIAPMVLENDGVTVDEAGVAYLAPLQIDEDLPFDPADTEGFPIWIGEFSGKVVCVAGNVIFERDTTSHPNAGTWIRDVQLAGVALKGAVATFGGKLLVGYGSSAVAQVTTNLTVLSNVKDNAAHDMYVWAATADQASIYVAGGITTSTSNQVMDSTNAASGFSGAVTCGDSDHSIKSLSPGGGIAIVYVGKDNELGEIDSSGDYRVLVPFDSTLATNCSPVRWWMATGGREQRGPLVMVFPRDRGLWAYQPSSQNSGQAENISPWSVPYIRPLNVRGVVHAIQGSVRWLYYTVQNSAGNSWVIRRDARIGASNIFINVGAYVCSAMTITTLIGTNPLLFFGKGNNISYVILPLDGESFLVDSACRFCSTGTLIQPDADLGFPDENKVLYSERIMADSVSGNQSLTIYSSTDGGSYSSLGTVSSGPSSEVSYPSGTTCKRWGIKVQFDTTDATQTPQLRGIVTRTYLNTRLLRQWSFQAKLPPGFLRNRSNPVTEEYVVQRTLWNDRSSGIPVTFVDRYGDTWNVKVLKVQDKEVLEDETKERSTLFGMVLLETRRTGGGWVWGDGSSWGSPYVQWG